MRQFRDLPLSQRLILVLMMASCATLLLSAASFITNDIISMRKSAGDDLETLAQMVGAASTAAIIFEDSRAAEETLGILANQPQIKTAAIYNMNEEVLAKYHSGDEASAQLPQQITIDQVLFNNDHVEIYSPVRLEGKIIGSVFMRSDLQKLDKRLAWYFRVVLAVLVISLIVAYLLSRRLQHIIAGPIVKLAGLARKITNDKNYALRAVRETSDEVGDLISSFNEMLEEIQARDIALAGHRDSLEETVAQRTAEIKETNKRLELAKQKAETAAASLAHQAFHDALTGLPNRTLLNDRLSVALAHAEREAQKLALLFLDLDDFKLINDTLGHEVGDELLCAVSAVLESCIRAEDTVARLGGDEFMILLTGIEDNEDAGLVARKVIDTLSQPLICSGHELHLAVSIGISIYPEDGTDGVDLMRAADASMYRAKATGRNLFKYYQTDIGAASCRRLALENHLRRAIERNEFSLHYQPQVTPGEQRIVGVEALIRWHNPELGMVMPDQFIPLAEDIGLISEIGEWVIREACNHGKRWHEMGFHDLQVAVNLSPRQFRKHHVEEVVTRVLSETGFPAACLELEITENLSMQNVQTTIVTLQVLQGMGVKLAIDDFGTGYSSLSYLTKFPIHTLKIDRSFVRDIPQSKEDAALAKAIIVMAQGLGLRVVAEGIETRQQLAFFRKNRCDVLQGYLFGKPLPVEALDKLLAEESALLAEAGKQLASEVIE